MADFLANLVDRSFDRAPVLVRRRPALFEPVADTPTFDGAQFGNEGSLREEESTSPSKPPPSIQGPSNLRSPSFKPSQPQPTQFEARVGRQEHAHAVEIQTEGDARLPELDVSAASPVPRPNQLNRDARRILSLPPKENPKPEERTPERQRLMETIVEKRVERQVTSEPSRRQTRKEVEPTSVMPSSLTRKSPLEVHAIQSDQPAKTEAEPLAPENKSRLKSIGLQKPPRPIETPAKLRAVLRSQPSRPISEPAPPTIQVTIGRVEVRATTTQVAHKGVAARPAAAKLSLEDYLRSRSKGN